MQVPQLTVRTMPQLSAAVTTSQALPRRWQNTALVSSVQPHTLLAPPPPQVFGSAHVPHARLLPQPSEMLPQFLPCVPQLVGMQGPWPQMFGMLLAPQTSGAWQAGPQLIGWPQLLLIVPQFLPLHAVLFGVHPH